MVDIRLLESEDDLFAAGTLFRTAMVGLPFPPLQRSEISTIFEPGRTYGAFVDGVLVGTTDSYSGALTVPGGRAVPQAAVTHVGVLPGYTRRGISTALAQRQLSDARKRGEAFASLRASDGRIYGNFGYGVASFSTSIEVEREKAHLIAQLPLPSGIRLVEAGSAWDLLARIYRDHPPARSGIITRSPYWWDFQKYKQGLSRGPSYVAVHGPSGGEDGYVRYHPVGLDDWFVSSQRTIVVDDLVARSHDTYLALIAHLLRLDLPHRIVFANRPADDPLFWLFHDPRAAKLMALREETWLRIADVEQALAARSYGHADPVVLAVDDALLPENTRTIRLSSQSVEQSNEAPQAKVDISSLAAAYLGAAKWWQLQQAGRVWAEDAEVIGRLDALFAAPAQPHSGTMF